VVGHYRFTVCIPQREYHSKIAYQQNLAAFFRRMNNLKDANRAGVAATGGPMAIVGSSIQE
jgi:hypothetical protein